MKFYKILLAGGLLLEVATLSSCKKFLDQEPQTSWTKDQTYSSIDKINLVVGGLLTSWRNIHKDRGGFVFQLGGDESQQGAFQVITTPDQAGLDRYDGYLSPANNALAEQWRNRWSIVVVAAQSIDGLVNLKDTSNATLRNQLLGQAYFIRATMSFELSQYWGSIPIIDYSINTTFANGRKPLDQVYTQIIADLQTAINYLPETQNDKKLATKYAALALLGKVYLYAPVESKARDYQKAADAFNKVISSGKYSLVSNYADLWDPAKANGPESIYEFQFTNAYPDNNQIQWQMGSRALANIDGLCYFGGYDLMVPTKYCYSDVANGGIWESGDIRKENSIRYDFTYNGQTPTIPAGFGGDELDPHVKKFEDIRTQGTFSFWNSGKDVFYLRYSDILLNYAECLNELGKTADAVAVVNQVRNRAFGGTTPANLVWSSGMGQDSFRTQMLDERMRELCFEGWRRMDLIRSGKFVQLIKARNKWAAASGTIQSFNQLYPIPIYEIQLQSGITPDQQNAGYTN